jgi:hypothetical protein
MANELDKFFDTKLPAQADLVKHLAAFAATKPAIGGRALLRLTRAGQWVFGADNEAWRPEDQFIVNPASLASGYIAWWLAKPEEEIMQPLSQGPVDPDRLGPVKSGTIPPGKTQASGRGWEAQVSFEMITRSKTPMAMIYKTSSLGGRRAVLTLAGDIAFGVSEDPNRVFPVCVVDTDSYTHAEFGEVFTPEFHIVGWLDANGKELGNAPDRVAQEAESSEPKPKRTLV